MPEASCGFGAADILSAAASIATILALIYAGYQFRQSGRAASATSSALILANIRARVDEVARQDTEAGRYDATCDLLNELELSCALYFDGQFGGMTGKNSISFIKSIMGSIERNDVLLSYAQKAVHDPDTFECIRKFAEKYKSDWKALNSAR